MPRICFTDHTCGTDHGVNSWGSSWMAVVLSPVLHSVKQAKCVQVAACSFDKYHANLSASFGARLSGGNGAIGTRPAPTAVDSWTNSAGHTIASKFGTCTKSTSHTSCSTD